MNSEAATGLFFLGMGLIVFGGLLHSQRYQWGKLIIGVGLLHTMPGFYLIWTKALFG